MPEQSIQPPMGGADGRRGVASASPLSAFIGAHPATLRRIYARGKPADPTELGDAPRGRVLGIEPASSVFLLLRPLVRALATDALPWRGKVFDHGGNSGQNVVFGKRVLRFRADVAPSILDGEPTLVLRYDSPTFHNPWPIRAIVDELRSVDQGVALGPVYAVAGHRKHVLLWWGLEQG